jgi:hypothetical protein
LLCDVSGIPRPEFIWTRDDVVIKSDGVRVSVEESGSLIISSVELTDFGRYICNASNLEGYIVSSAAIVIVEESTCFDDLFTNEHESDIDCGGPHCKPCNETQVSLDQCLDSRDCIPFQWSSTVCLIGIAERSYIAWGPMSFYLGYYILKSNTFCMALVVSGKQKQLLSVGRSTSNTISISS